jgi:type IV secretion system protein VirB6
MVSGWRVFGLVPDNAADGTTQTVYTIPQTGTAMSQQQQSAASTGVSPSRQIPISAVTTSAPANDPGTGLAPAAARETRIINNVGGSGQVQPFTANTSRTRGIGNRFKSPGAKPIGDKTGSNAMTEKFK